MGRWIMGGVGGEKMVLWCGRGRVMRRVVVILDLGCVWFVGVVWGYGLEGIMLGRIFGVCVKGVGRDRKGGCWLVMM